MKKFGLGNITSDGTNIRLDLNFNDGDCGCSPNTGVPGGSSVVTWNNIQGKPECILDCATLAVFIKEHGLDKLQNSDEIIMELDTAGLVSLKLVPRGIIEAAYGTPSSTVRVTVNPKGVILAIEEVPIEISSDQVLYNNILMPGVDNVTEALDQLATTLFTRIFYEHNQTVASTTWTIVHNMGKKPSVTIIDGTGNLAFANLAYNNDNQVTLTFSEAVSGTAYCN